MTKIDPSEIVNPRKTLQRREQEAGLDTPAGMQPPARDSGQLMFTRPVPVDPEKKRRQDRQFQELMRKRQEEDRKRRREFERTFREGTDEDPLTEAVEASRRAARAPAAREDAAYRKAYQEN